MILFQTLQPSVKGVCVTGNVRWHTKQSYIQFFLMKMLCMFLSPTPSDIELGTAVNYTTWKIKAVGCSRTKVHFVHHDTFQNTVIFLVVNY